MTDRAIIDSIAFPTVQYFDPLPKPAFAIVMQVVHSWEELAVFGQRISRWPLRRFWIPGGLLDSKGKEFAFLDVRNLPKMPFWLKPIDPILGSYWYLGRFEADLVIGEPKQLSLEEFKERLARNIGRERSFRSGQGISFKRSQQLVREAKSFREAINRC